MAHINGLPVLVLVLALYMYPVACGPECTIPRIVRCIKDMKDHIGGPPTISPVLNETEWTDMCSALEEAVDCLDDMQECSAAEDYIDFYSETFQALCEDTSYDEYEQYQSCTVENVVFSDFRKCMEGVKWIQFDCSDFQDAYSCYFDLVDSVCGADAAEYQKDVAEPLLNFLSATIGDGSECELN